MPPLPLVAAGALPPRVWRLGVPLLELRHLARLAGRGGVVMLLTIIVTLWLIGSIVLIIGLCWAAGRDRS